MGIVHPTRVLTAAFFAALSILACGPARAADCLYYPLAGITTPAALQTRIMSGGMWLSGLPGHGNYVAGKVHAGIDLRAHIGEPIFAVTDGVVDTATGIHGGYGPGWTPGGVFVVRSKGPNGVEFLVLYGHTQNHQVAVGQAIRAGEHIADVGDWLATEGGPHLHLTVRIGSLPRYGWGTPTLLGSEAKPGAEVVQQALDVRTCGYRNPLQLLNGELLQELTVGAGAPPLQRDLLIARHEEGYMQGEMTSEAGGAVSDGITNEFGLPCAETSVGTNQAAHIAGGFVQTFRRADGQVTALMLCDGSMQVCRVRGSIWTTYSANGGPTRFGYPLGEAYVQGADWVQAFQRGSFIVSQRTGRVFIR